MERTRGEAIPRNNARNPSSRVIVDNAWTVDRYLVTTPGF